MKPLKEIFKISYLIIFYFFMHGNNMVYAQGRDESYTEYSNITSDSSFYILYDTLTPAIHVTFKTPFKIGNVSRTYRDSKSVVLFKQFSLFTSNRLQTQFVNDSVWFIYGDRISYAYYPFIAATNDSGKTWNIILETWGKRYNWPIGGNRLHFYNEDKGVWMNNIIYRTLSYRTTSDGGKTWENQKFHFSYIKAPQWNFTSHYKIAYDDTFTMLTIEYRKKGINNMEAPRYSVQYVSYDYGKTFKKMR